jgi:hypothetical protein
MSETSLIKFLTQKLRDDHGVTSEVFAALIVSFLMNNPTNYGSEIPKQREMVSQFQLPEKIVEDAWKILQNVYKIIITGRGIGTRYIDKIDKEKWIQINGHYSTVLSGYTIMALNHLTKSALASEQKGFAMDKRYAFNRAETNGSGSYHYCDKSGLHDNITKWFSEKTMHTFSTDELYYTDDMSLLKGLTDLYANRLEKLVIINPLSFANPDPEKTLSKKWSEVTCGTAEVFITDLNAYCLTHKVNMVYITPPTPLPYDKGVFRIIWQELKSIAENQSFKVLVNDPYGDLIRDRVLFKPENEHIEKPFYYMTSLSMVDEEFKGVSIIIGPRRDITDLKKKYHYKPWVFSRTAFALEKWFLAGNFKKHEIPIEDMILTRTELATDQFKTSGLFKDWLLDRQQRWFYHLEPRVGRFSRDIHKNLIKLGIEVINPKLLPFSHHYKNGITISISSFKSDTRQKKDLGILIQCLSRQIKNS